MTYNLHFFFFFAIFEGLAKFFLVPLTLRLPSRRGTSRVAGFALLAIILLHVGWADEDMCKASVPIGLFTKGRVGKRSSVKSLGACPIPYHNTESL